MLVKGSVGQQLRSSRAPPARVCAELLLLPLLALSSHQYLFLALAASLTLGLAATSLHQISRIGLLAPHRLLRRGKYCVKASCRDALWRCDPADAEKCIHRECPLKTNFDLR
mmetsp:Transcript_16695/g.25280  ORF Transcript_16695/g.25280 Transcript_16695/m.25280 type:complete len:112 (+) Transcript_16695:154-489(+)